MIVSLEYEKFKARYLAEQYYTADRLYWHMSKNDFSKIENKSTGLYGDIPVFISKSVDFFYEEKENQFSILEGQNKDSFIYCISLRRNLNIFNNKNEADVEKAEPFIRKFITRLKEPDSQKRLALQWQEYINTGHWNFIEVENMYGIKAQNRLLYKVLKEELKYDGFHISSYFNNGLLGIFDARVLEIKRKYTVEEFYKLFYDSEKHKEDGIKRKKLLIPKEYIINIAKEVFESDKQSFVENRLFYITHFGYGQ